jgi:hypothetical protein
MGAYLAVSPICVGVIHSAGGGIPHFTPESLRFVAFGSPRVARLRRLRPSTTQQPPGATQMITAFFTFVTVAFFIAIAANVAEAVSGVFAA